MTERSVIIIGAGVAGLAAGCYAQMNGYRSQIFELHDLPGGMVPPAAVSGRNVIQLICRADGRPFVTNIPA